MLDTGSKLSTNGYDPQISREISGNNRMLYEQRQAYQNKQVDTQQQVQQQSQIAPKVSTDALALYNALVEGHSSYQDLGEVTQMTPSQIDDCIEELITAKMVTRKVEAPSKPVAQKVQTQDYNYGNNGSDSYSGVSAAKPSNPGGPIWSTNTVAGLTYGQGTDGGEI